MTHRVRLALWIFLVTVVATSGPAVAAPGDYPTRDVQIIVPFAPGGGADASQRTFNKFAEPIVGRPLVILNRPGAGGATGWAELVRQRPDGYTLAITTPPFSIIPPLVKPRQTGYKLDQLDTICIYAVVPDVLLVREDSPWRTLKDFVDHAKANPKKVKAGNTGTLGADFMTTLLIENATGIEMTQIPFTGGAQQLQAALSGTIDAMVASTLFSVAQKGKMRTLAIASTRRDPALPDVPTFRELGYNVVSERYRALSGPKGMPGQVIDYWARVCKQVVDNPQFREEMAKIGQPAAFLGPQEARSAVNTMTEHIQTLVERYKLAE